MNVYELSPGFWQAALHVHQYLVDVEAERYFNTPLDERQGHVFESLQVLGSWLFVAESIGLIRELDS